MGGVCLIAHICGWLAGGACCCGLGFIGFVGDRLYDRPGEGCDVFGVAMDIHRGDAERVGENFEGRRQQLRRKYRAAGSITVRLRTPSYASPLSSLTLSVSAREPSFAIFDGTLHRCSFLFSVSDHSYPPTTEIFVINLVIPTRS